MGKEQKEEEEAEGAEEEEEEVGIIEKIEIKTRTTHKIQDKETTIREGEIVKTEEEVTDSTVNIGEVIDKTEEEEAEVEEVMIDQEDKMDKEGSILINKQENYQKIKNKYK